MSEQSLLEALRAYGASGVCPMHMPGHKRNAALLGDALPYGIDVTEVEGFDNLQNPEGILLRTEALAAKLYGSRRAFLSVNGSTGALLAAVYACARPYEKVILARNSHRSVYAALEIRLLRPVYLPEPVDGATGIAGSVSPSSVRAALAANPDARLVVVPSPTYAGVECDLRGIAKAAHEAGVPLLVDAAHGAHLGLSPAFGENAVRAGADLAVMSLHKTLPALTQCALLHLGGAFVNEAALRGAVNTFQTSSPSYVLLASIDACLRLLEKDGPALFAAYEARLASFGEKMKALRRLRVLCAGNDAPGNHPSFFRFDPGKLVLLTRGAADLTGPALARALRERYRIETEMAAPDYGIAMTSICDPDEHFDRLAAALLEIDAGLGAAEHPGSRALPAIPEMAFAPWEAAGDSGEALAPAEAAGRVSLEYVWAYPPGVPLLVPGEVVPPDFAALCRRTEESGVRLRGTRGAFPRLLACKKRESG